MSEIDTRSKTKKKSTQGVVPPVEVDAKRLAKRRTATFGVGLKASQKNEVEDRASETEETTLPPVSEDAVGKSSVGGTEVALESDSKVLTGSRAGTCPREVALGQRTIILRFRKASILKNPPRKL
jgi:hypothetical protein